MITIDIMASPARACPAPNQPAPLAATVQELASVLGRKLTAYIGGAKSITEVDRWMLGTDADTSATGRLRLGFAVVNTLKRYEDKRVVQAWFTGLNPALGERSPIRVLREETPETASSKLMSAARSFLARG